MICFANQFQLYVQEDGLVRIDCNAIDPLGKTPPQLAVAIYMRRADALELGKILVNTVPKAIKGSDGEKMN